MKITVNQGNGYIVLETEMPRDLYTIGRISARLNATPFETGKDQKELHISYPELLKILDGSK